jgi:hypothetical protein
MEVKRRWLWATLRGIGGAIAGAICGAFGAGLFVTTAYWVAEAVGQRYAGLHTVTVMVFSGAAGLAIPGSVIAGAVGAIWRRPIRGALAGFGVMLGPTLYLCVRAWLEDDSGDCSVLDFLLYGGSLLIGPLAVGLAGALATLSPRPATNYPDLQRIRRQNL